MGWQERGAFEVVPLQSPRRSAAGGVSLISPLLALSAQVEELDPAGGERRTGGKEGEKDGGRVGGKEGVRKKKTPPSLSLSSSLTFSFPARACYLNLVTGVMSQKKVFKLYVSLRTLVTERQPGNVYKQRYLAGCVSALRQYTNNLRSLSDIPEKALPPIS